MKRRPLLGLAIGTTASLSGCLGRIRPPEVIGDEPTLSPGEEATLSIEARSARGLRFEELPDETHAVLEIGDAEIEPSPSRIAESYPPDWYWRFARWSVEVRVPIRIPPDSPPGEYQYAVTVTATDDIRSDATTEEFSILVE
ncbi:COG1361 family protein [Natronobacterium texcoconense]|uniref:Uncharacterized protein n=1 Tax=Natronobacterium texcoconense TaxID=1095778 RepID=A0A1H1IEX6_NATTX|nr:hypothetical protein [Natronobacterium texcoconense]SDR35856.1 hypothetical protein SAMN04489842_3471 [Natronobacterium texcoconense]